MSERNSQHEFPTDVSKMSVRELEREAAAIRAFLIDHVSETGGHLASNLGVVEITLGLHKLFRTPKDKIIWDVGHQCYVHKILTGRADQFDHLRQHGGISGFPKRCESEHDFYDTGHSSTSLSAALGMATARDLRGRDGEVIAVIGDGSMTGGPAFEALNNIAGKGTKVIIVLNDNGMSISRNIGGLSKHLGKLRTSAGYQQAKINVKKVIRKVPTVGPVMESAISSVKDRVKYAILSGGVLFEELGFTYLGPFNGNDMRSVLDGLTQAKHTSGPVVVHFITKKGKGYRPAEEDPNRFHGIGPFDKETGKTLSPSGVTYSAVFGETAVELAEEDPSVVAVTAAMGDATGLTEFRKRFPKRLFDVGIAEAHGVIFAAGAALGGLKPIVAIYSSFLQRAYDEILEDVCLQNQHVVFAIDRAGIVGADGETHHGIFDLSYLSSMPNMVVYAPCDGPQLKEALRLAMQAEGPVAVRYPRGKAEQRSLAGQAFTGENIRVKDGAEGDILAVGTMLAPALEAAALLEKEGHSFGVVNVAKVHPFDPAACGEKGLIVTVEDNVLSGGFGDHVAAALPQREVLTLGWPDLFPEHGTTGELYREYGLDAAGIAASIRSRLERKA